MDPLVNNFSSIMAELKSMGETKQVSPKIGKLILNMFLLMWGVFKVFVAALYTNIFGKLNKVLPIPSIPSKLPEV
jgi:hypothetical protein